MDGALSQVHSDKDVADDFNNTEVWIKHLFQTFNLHDFLICTEYVHLKQFT